jgi:drug/metabolite transporter (DMT)-like permease
MRRSVPLALFLSILMVLAWGGSALAKPLPGTLTGSICVSDASTISYRYAYSGFKRVDIVAFEFQTAGGALTVGGFGAPGPRSGSGSLGFLWVGTVANVQATGIRASLYTKNMRLLGVSDWAPITDNSPGGQANNGWPAC